VDLIPISALTRLHVRRLLKRVAHVLAETPPPVEDEHALPVYRPREEPSNFEVLREGKDKWRLRGAAIERAASMTYWQHDGSVRRFQKLMERLGVDDRLRESGVQQGDTVAVGDYELEWKD
jgi:GTP-binding protein